MKNWTLLDSREVWRRPWFALKVERLRTARGVVLEDYPVIETRDWACIVTVTDRHELVLVRQYRHGVQAETMEFPAGGIDPGEAPESAARRELLEETGYQSDDWQHLRTLSPEPTRHRHRAHLFLARNARRVAEQSLEPSEDVDVVLEDARAARELVARLSHGIHIAALFLALERTGGQLF